MRAWQQFLISKFQAEYDRLFLWAPVFFAAGIGIFFTSQSQLSLLWLASAFILLFITRQHYLWRLFCLALLFIFAGNLVASFKTDFVKTTMLEKKLENVTFQATVLSVERRPRDQRVILGSVLFDEWSRPEEPPDTLRLNIRQKSPLLEPGQRAQFQAILRPLEQPITQGAYDFAHHGYFQGFGASGFTTKAPVIIDDSSSEAFSSLRHKLTQRLRQQMPGHSGAVAAALITGDRSGITNKLSQQFADAGIAHILAISGLHLSILAGLVFLLIRRGFCLIPRLALNYPTKKWAAALTILVTLGYLLLSGVGTPALRAFCMTTLIMVAILLDRTALTLRNVALAALFILFFWPEMLLSPSFQLSFAAVTALIAAYESFRSSKPQWLYKIPKPFQYVSGVMLTTVIASLATMPYAIYTFNRFSLHAIEANLLAIPLTTFWIMPAALLTVLTLPLSLADYPMLLLEKGINLLITVASQVSSWPGSIVLVPQIPKWTLISITICLLWLLIWKTKWRMAGLFPLIPITLFLITQKPPDVFISKRYALIGIKDGDTLWLNDLNRGRLIAATWQQLAGLPTRKSLADHPNFTCDDNVCKGSLWNQTISLSRQWRPPLSDCADVMLSFSWSHRSCHPKIKITGKDLNQEGTNRYGVVKGELRSLD